MDHISGIPSCDKLLPVSLTLMHVLRIETWPCIPYYLNLSSGACPASAPRTLTSPQVFGSSVWDKDKRAWIPGLLCSRAFHRPSRELPSPRIASYFYNLHTPTQRWLKSNRFQ